MDPPCYESLSGPQIKVCKVQRAFIYFLNNVSDFIKCNTFTVLIDIDVFKPSAMLWSFMNSEWNYVTYNLLFLED